MSEDIMRVGMDNSGYVAGARIITKANLDIETSSNKAASAISGLEGRFGRVGAASTPGISEARKALESLDNPVKNLRMSLEHLENRLIRIGATVLVFRALGSAVGVVTGFFKEGINAVDSYQQTLIGITASLTQIAVLNNTKSGGNKSLSQMYSDSARYAEVLAEKMRQVDILSIANYDQIMQMLQVYTSTGRVLDVNNQKQMSGFTALSNAIPMMTTGQDKLRQMTTEMRALATGSLTAGSTIARALDSMIKADGIKEGLKGLVKQAKETGVDILELVEPYLKGYTAALPKIAQSFQTAKSSFETAINASQRKIFTPIVNDFSLIIQGAIKEVNDGTGVMANMVQGAWNKIRDSLFNVSEAISETGESTKKITIKPEVIEGFKSVFGVVTNLAAASRDAVLFVTTHLEGITKLAIGYSLLKVSIMATAIAMQIKNSIALSGIAVHKSAATLEMEAIEAKLAAEAKAIIASRENLAAIQAELAANQELAASNLQKAEQERTMAVLSQTKIQGAIAYIQAQQALTASNREAMIVELNALKVTQAKAAYEAEYAIAVANVTKMQMDQNRIKQMNLGLQMQEIQSTIQLQTAKQQAAVEENAQMIQLTEAKIRDLQLDQMRYQGTGTKWAQLKGWRAEELRQIEVLRGLTQNQIVLEERLATAKMKANIRLGGDDVQAANIALLAEQEALQKKYNAQVASASGLEAKRAAATEAVNTARAALNANIGNSIALETELYNAESRLAAVENQLAGANARVAASEAELEVLRVKQLSMDPAIIAAVERHNAALMKKGITTGLLTEAQVAQMAAEERATVLNGAYTASLSAMTLSARLTAGAVGLLNGAMALVGGPLGAITIALYAGYLAWEKWGNAAGKAIEKAKMSKDQSDGVIQGLKDRLAAFEAQKKLQEEIDQNKLTGKPVSDGSKLGAALDNTGTLSEYLKVQQEMWDAQKRIYELKNKEDNGTQYAEKEIKAQEVIVKAKVQTLRELQKYATEVNAKMPVAAPPGAPPTGPEEDDSTARLFAAQRALRDAQFQYLMAIQKKELDALKDNEKLKQEAMKYAFDQGEISEKQYLDLRYESTLKYYDKEIEIVKLREAEVNASVNKAAKAMGTGKGKTEGATKAENLRLEADYYKELARQQDVQRELAGLEADKVRLGQDFARDKVAANERITKTYEDQNIELLKAQGLELEAFQASKQTEEYKRTVLNVDESRLEYAQKIYNSTDKNDKAATEAALRELNYAKGIIAGREKLNKLLENEIKLRKENSEYEIISTRLNADKEASAYAATQVGADPRTGKVNDDEISKYKNEKAVEDDRHKSEMDRFNAQMEHLKKVAELQKGNDVAHRQALAEIYAVEQQINTEKDKHLKNKGAIDVETQESAYKKIADIASKTWPKISGFQTAAHMLSKKYATEEVGLNEDGTKKYKMSMEDKLRLTIDVGNLASEVFQGLADTQDKTSKKGFESAKSYAMAAAVMNTAAAVVNALATVQPYPMAVIAAAGAAAAGAVQIAKIASTSFGSSGSVSAPSGSFGGGGASNSATGAKIGKSFMSTSEQQSYEELRLAAKSMNSASLELRKVSDGLTTLTGLFKDDKSKKMIENAPGTYVNLTYQKNLLSQHFSDLGTFFKDTLKSGNIMLAAFKYGMNVISHTITSITGWGAEWETKAAGVSIGVNNGGFTGRNYIDQTKDGGWFGSDKHRTTYSAMDEAFSSWLEKYVKGMGSQVGLASTVLGTTSNISGVNIPEAKIKIAGRKQEDIEKDLETWMNKVGNAFAKTVVGLQEFTAPGEAAYDALMRLATALQTANQSFALIGHTLLSDTLISGNYASKLMDLMGGTEKFAETVKTYFESMFTEAQQNAMKSASDRISVNAAFADINSTFADMKLSVPQTKQEFINLVNSLDLTTEQGAAVFASLMNVAPAFGEMIDLTNKFADSVRSFNADVQERMLRAEGLDKEADLYALRVKQEDEMRKAIEDGMDVTALRIVQDKEWANAVADATNSVSDSIQSLADSTKSALLDMIDAQKNVIKAMRDIKTGSLSNLSPTEKYEQTKAAFEALQGKTDLASVQALPDAAKDFLTASKDYFASGQNYQTDLSNVMNALGSVASISPDSTVSQMDQQVTLLDQIRKAVEDGATETVNQLSSVLGPESLLVQLIANWNKVTQDTQQANITNAASETLTKLNDVITEINNANAILTPENLSKLQDLAAKVASDQNKVNWYQSAVDSVKGQIATSDNIIATDPSRAASETVIKAGLEDQLKVLLDGLGSATNQLNTDKSAYDSLKTSMEQAAAALPNLIQSMNALTNVLQGLATQGSTTSIPSAPSTDTASSVSGSISSAITAGSASGSGFTGSEAVGVNTGMLDSAAVTVFRDPNFSGISKVLGVGDYRSSDSIGIGNDTLSSITIADGYQAILYKDTGFGGYSKVLGAGKYASVSAVGFPDNAMTSMKVMKAYALGGIATEASIFGETGQPEAAVPLPDGRTIPVTFTNSGSKGVENRLDKMLQVLLDMEKRLSSIENKKRLEVNKVR